MLYGDRVALKIGRRDHRPARSPFFSHRNNFSIFCGSAYSIFRLSR